MDLTQFGQVVLWISGVGAPILVSYLLSWVVENWKAWSTLPKNVKFLAPMIVSVILSVGSAQLLNYPKVIETIQPYFQVIMSAILSYLASQKAYMSVLKAGYGKRFETPKSDAPVG